MPDYKEISVWLLLIIALIFLPIVMYEAGQADGFNEGYQQCLVDFKHKDKQ